MFKTNVHNTIYIENKTNGDSPLLKKSVTVILYMFLVIFLVSIFHEPTNAAQAYFEIPEGVIASNQTDPDYYVSPTENPLLKGNIDISFIEELRHLGPRSEFGNSRELPINWENEEQYCCQGVAVTADFPVFRDGKDTSFVWLEPRENDDDNTVEFIVPWIRLPEDGTIVTFELRKRISISEYSPPIATIKLKLASGVHILPVHVHVLANSEDYSLPNGWLTEEIVRNWFEPSPSYDDRADIGFDFESQEPRVEPVQKLIPNSGFTAPDGIWSQAGIQFRLESYDIIEQSYGLKETLFSWEEADINNGFCGSGYDKTRLGQLRNDYDHSSIDGIHVYIGGYLAAYEAVESEGALGKSCRGGSIIALSARHQDGQLNPFESTVLAHELGHSLGLGHSEEVGDLMYDNTVTFNPGTNLTEDEIQISRENACQKLEDWSGKPIICFPNQFVVEDNVEDVNPDFYYLAAAYDANTVSLQVGFSSEPILLEGSNALFLSGTRHHGIAFDSKNFSLFEDTDLDGEYETRLLDGELSPINGQSVWINIPVSYLPDITTKQIWAYSIISRDRIPNDVNLALSPPIDGGSNQTVFVNMIVSLPTTTLDISNLPPNHEIFIDWGDNTPSEQYTEKTEHVYKETGVYSIYIYLKSNKTVVTSDQVQITVKPYRVYLPVTLLNYTSAPDLIVENVYVSQDDARVVVTNIGNADTAEAFWVDLCVEPLPAPYQANDTCDDGRSQHMLIWGVTTNISPGESLILSRNDLYYWSSLSSFPSNLPEGTSVYVHVDSANINTTYGNVLEDHEILGGAYNNVFGPVLSTKNPILNYDESINGLMNKHPLYTELFLPLRK